MPNTSSSTNLVDVTNAYRFTAAGDFADHVRQVAHDRAAQLDIRDHVDDAHQRALRHLVAFATSPSHVVVFPIGIDDSLALAAFANEASACIDLASEDLDRAGIITVNPDDRTLTFDLEVERLA